MKAVTRYGYARFECLRRYQAMTIAFVVSAPLLDYKFLLQHLFRRQCPLPTDVHSCSLPFRFDGQHHLIPYRWFYVHRLLILSKLVNWFRLVEF